MQLSEIEREQLYAIVEKYDHHPDVQRMREYIQHGSVTTYQHCKNVALVSFWLNRRLHLHADETSLAVGALLHDFYLYDWHTTGTFHGLRRLFEMHGFSHPGYACVNAKRVFSITTKEQSIIASHMWPLTFRHVPTCREAVIVCLADGVIAGWTALRRVDPRWCYRGVAEVSIYVGEQFRGHGLGYHLLTELCHQAEKAGYWTLQSTVLQDNAASRALHTKCGFRLVGRRERIARDCHGRWLDTFLMEYRAAANEPEGYKKL